MGGIIPLSYYSAVTDHNEVMEIVNHSTSKHQGLRYSSLAEDVICKRVDSFTQKQAKGNETWREVLIRLVSDRVAKQRFLVEVDAAAFAAVHYPERERSACWEP